MSRPISWRLATTTLAVSALLLTACSSATGGATSGSASAPAAGPVTLTLWHNSGDSQALLDLYKAYEKATGNTLTLVDLPTDTFPTAVQTKWAAGDRPDILEYMPAAQDMRQLNMAENMIDLTSMDFVKAEGNLAGSAGSLDGKTYGAVLGPVATFGAFYNKDVIKASGIDMPTGYDKLLAECSKIKATGAAPVFVGGGSEFPANMIAGFAYMADFNAGDAYGLAVAAGTTKVNDASGPIVGGLTAVANLRDAGCLNSDASTATFQEAVKAVYTGKAAMTILPSDFIAQFYDANKGDAAVVDAKIGFSAISATKGIASYAAGSYGTYYVPKTGDAAKEAAAQAFIKWVSGAGYQDYITSGKVITTMSTATTPAMTGLYSDMAKMISDPNSTPAFNNSIPGFGNFGKIAVSVLAKQNTPQQAADKFETFVDQAIAAQK